MACPRSEAQWPLDRLSVWAESCGAGEPVLCISGLGYSAWCWQELRDALCESYRVVRFDNRGTGRSDKPPAPYSIGMLADDVAALLDAMGIAQAHVVGHSMGGYIALTLAQNHPQKVRSLVLVGTSPGGPDTLPVPEATRAAWGAAIGLAPVEYARRTMPLSFAPGWTEAHPQEFESYLRRRVEFPTPPDCWLAQFNACADYVAGGVDLSRIRQRTLAVHGTADRVVPFENGLLLRGLPDVDWKAIEGAGHIPYLEDPAWFARVVREHLRRNTT
ncbi:MAG TPA: alpha/beta hydrolase [Solimonas sp.]|nr:alpha/beta hydrolase [Solimonas sp.]